MEADAPPKLSLYIDGFNLYRRLLENHPHDKWLDVEALARHVYPEYELARVRYFTAIIKRLPGADPQSPQRQQAYVRALATLPLTTIHYGKFRVDPRVMPIHPTELLPDGQPRTVKVKKTEEKGSDVALASMLMLDAMRGKSDLYAVCTNDSDLVMPLRLVKEKLGRRIGLLSPMQPKRASNELKQIGPDDHRQITIEALSASQLPDQLTDEHGVIHRPEKWARHSEGPAEAGPSNQ